MIRKFRTEYCFSEAQIQQCAVDVLTMMEESLQSRIRSNILAVGENPNAYRVRVYKEFFDLKSDDESETTPCIRIIAEAMLGGGTP